MSADYLLSCAVCYGDPNSLMMQGLNWGIFVLLGVTTFVLAGFAAFFVQLARRSRLAETQENRDF